MVDIPQTEMGSEWMTSTVYNMMIASFPNGKAEYQQIPKIKLVYILHNFGRDREGVFFPDTIQMQNEGFGTSKGDTIPIYNNWWTYIRKINSDRGYEYTRSVYLMWINRPYAEGETPRAERIHCGGNFASWDLETDTHVRLISFPNNYDTNKLNPLVDNWHNKPHLFWKACAVNTYGEVRKVANSLDVYFPLINDNLNRGLWMLKSRIVMFPQDSYTFKDGDVYLRGELFYRTGVVK